MTEAVNSIGENGSRRTAVDVLFLPTASAEPVSIAPVLASLHALDLVVRVVDSTSLEQEGAVTKIWQTLTGDTAKDKIDSELRATSPRVVMSTSAEVCHTVFAQVPATTVRVAFVTDWQPSLAWANVVADRYFTMDEHAAVALQSLGVAGGSIVPLGVFCELAFVKTREIKRQVLRQRFGLATSKVVTIEVEKLSREEIRQVATELASAGLPDVTYLFDAGDDENAAAAVRTCIPKVSLRAKLFGASSDAPLYWRASDVICGNATSHTVSRAVATGAKFVSFSGNVGGAAERALSLAPRKMGMSIHDMTELSAAITRALRLPAATPKSLAKDGARNLAESMVVLLRDSDTITAKRRQQLDAVVQADITEMVEKAKVFLRRQSKATGLEDLSSPPRFDQELPSKQQVTAVIRQIRQRMADLEAKAQLEQRQVDLWRRRLDTNDLNDSLGNDQGKKVDKRHADKQSQHYKQSMHKTLAELARYDGQKKKLEMLQQKLSEWKPTVGQGEATTGRARISSVSSSNFDTSSGTATPSRSRKPRKHKTTQRRSIEQELASLKKRAKKK